MDKMDTRSNNADLTQPLVPTSTIIEAHWKVQPDNHLTSQNLHVEPVELQSTQYKHVSFADRTSVEPVKDSSHKSSPLTPISSEEGAGDTSADRGLSEDSLDLPGFEEVHKIKWTYERGQQKSIYNKGIKYRSYRSESSTPLEQPPPAPASYDIPVHSLYAHATIHPNTSKKLVDIWVHIQQPGKGTTWKKIVRGYHHEFAGTTYYVGCKPNALASWVKHFSP
ncbi:hypothetical protein NP233_g7130 [Leucocoprinus birnbaumii]|uniref:Uncharacterized protein n=1 Tax=Leucocoprinus birnbaumii TaxID=56174 RepID=A0AAD5VSG9_9AGAR|nr:hypothetical protein NP233_g7130 [Leucocoprinus birnbaumii]